MMEQHEALRLASFMAARDNDVVAHQCAYELRRLHAENERLRAALRDVASWVPGREKWHTDEPIKAVERARAALKERQ